MASEELSRRTMNICEGCIKQDVCKFKVWVSMMERKVAELGFDEPMEVTITCKYKEVDDWEEFPYGTWPNCSVSTYTDPHPDCDATTTCGKEW